MDIRDMKPGRELDCLVAKKVMGYRVINREYAVVDDGPVNGLSLPFEFTPSEDISDAWEVVERMHNTPCKDGDHFASRVAGWRNLYCASFMHHLAGCPGDGGLEYFEARGETAPHAICLAALLAMEDKA